MPVIRHTDARRTETPNAVMTTYASPALGSTSLAMWHVDMGAGKQGPLHAMDVEQIWTLQSGSASVDLAGEVLSVSAGDTVVLPADVARQFSTAVGFTAIVAGLSPAHAYNPDAITPEGACGLAPKDDERVLPPWIA